MFFLVLYGVEGQDKFPKGDWGRTTQREIRCWSFHTLSICTVYLMKPSICNSNLLMISSLKIISVFMRLPEVNQWKIKKGAEFLALKAIFLLKSSLTLDRLARIRLPSMENCFCSFQHFVKRKIFLQGDPVPMSWYILWEVS